jgi:hypothetical protein
MLILPVDIGHSVGSTSSASIRAMSSSGIWAARPARIASAPTASATWREISRTLIRADRAVRRGCPEPAQNHSAPRSGDKHGVGDPARSRSDDPQSDTRKYECVVALANAVSPSAIVCVRGYGLPVAVSTRPSVQRKRSAGSASDFDARIG